MRLVCGPETTPPALHNPFLCVWYNPFLIKRQEKKSAEGGKHRGKDCGEQGV